MTSREDAFRNVADETLGLAVSVFTLCYENVQQGGGSLGITREIVNEHDADTVGLALAFICTLLATYTTPERVKNEKDALVRRALDG